MQLILLETDEDPMYIKLDYIQQGDTKKISDEKQDCITVSKEKCVHKIKKNFTIALCALLASIILFTGFIVITVSLVYKSDHSNFVKRETNCSADSLYLASNIIPNYKSGKLVSIAFANNDTFYIILKYDNLESAVYMVEHGRYSNFLNIEPHLIAQKLYYSSSLHRLYIQYINRNNFQCHIMAYTSNGKLFKTYKPFTSWSTCITNGPNNSVIAIFADLGAINIDDGTTIFNFKGVANAAYQKRTKCFILAVPGQNMLGSFQSNGLSCWSKNYTVSTSKIFYNQVIATIPSTDKTVVLDESLEFLTFFNSSGTIVSTLHFKNYISQFDISKHNPVVAIAVPTSETIFVALANGYVLKFVKTLCKH